MKGLNKLTALLSLVAGSVWVSTSHAIVINSGISAADAANALAGAGVTVQGSSYTGSGQAIGTFSGGFASGLGLDSGIILSTGNIIDALGPNNSSNSGVDLGTMGDADINAITGLTSEDAASLEFQFETTTNNIFLNFIFATEEFPEFVGLGFNDAFGFFVNGVNVALIPNTMLPITLNNLGEAGFIDNQGGSLNVQYDGVTNVFTAQALGLAAGLHTFKLVIADVGDGSLDSAVFLQAGSLASVEIPTGESHDPVSTLLGVSTTPEEVVIVDVGAIASAVGTGLPMALSQPALVQGATKTLTRDVSGRLFRMRTGPLQPAHSADDRFSYFASGDFGFIDRNNTDSLVGFDSDNRTATNGFEYRLNEEYTLGLSGGYVDTDTDVGEALGSTKLKGIAVSPYISFTDEPWYWDLLYSYSTFEHELRRKTGLGRTARAEPDSTNHFLQFNAGYNMTCGQFVTGPFITLDYLNGELDSYQETGGANANLFFDQQDYESLITRIGWQASCRFEVGPVNFIPQVRVAWERENLDDPNEVSGRLVTSPTTIIDSGGTRTQDFRANGQQEQPDSDYMTIGAGVRVGVGANIGIIFDYEGQFFRDDESAHFGSVSFDVPF